MRLAPVSICVLLLLAAGCTLTPFESGKPQGSSTQSTPPPGSGPVIPSVPEVTPTTPESESAAGGNLPAPAPLPRERPKATPATLSPASKSLVGQAQTQRKKGDLPGAAVSLERALRIEPNNPLLWIEMGRLRMDQHNYPQAEAMGRKSLSMSVGDNRTQSQAWLLISDALKARGRNPQAQDALAKSKELAQY
jgi:tetratricopeptide (TPR) repeat protein